mgnify:CR=1 FL=1
MSADSRRFFALADAERLLIRYKGVDSMAVIQVVKKAFNWYYVARLIEQIGDQCDVMRDERFASMVSSMRDYVDEKIFVAGEIRDIYVAVDVEI